LKDNSPILTGFNTRFAEDKILKLAFSEDSEVGTLISSPVKDKDRYLIAIFAAKVEKGAPKFEDVKLLMKADYIKEQKTLRFTKQMLNKKLDQIQGGTVLDAEVTMANVQLPNAGFEPKVVGSIFAAIKDGAKTLPIEGNSGVYVVKVIKTTKAPVAKDYSVEIKKLQESSRGQMQTTVRKSLTKLGDVIDNRRLYNIGVRR
jgi:peptidyl-prolyl cis-trans isomerase D